MRETKFRGKRIDNGERVYGYCCEANMGKVFIIQMNYLGQLVDCDEVIPETVGQFTGLSDKNGKEIYKKDIARKTFYDGFDGDVIGVVKFKPTKGYYLDCSHTKQTITKTHFDGGNFIEEEVIVKTASLTWTKDCIEVIGAVAENPELLEAKE